MRIIGALALFGLAFHPSPSLAQAANPNPAPLLIDSLTITIYFDPSLWVIDPDQFRLGKDFGMKPPPDLEIRSYPAPLTDINLMIQLVDANGRPVVDANGIPSPLLWKGQITRRTTLRKIPADSIKWTDQHDRITSGSFVARVKVAPPGTASADTRQFSITILN